MKHAATWEALNSLHPNPDNPRKNEHVIKDVAASIQRFGFSSPIIARAEDRIIIAGHTRFAAAQYLKLEKVPVRFLELTPGEATALSLADNRLGEKASWDDTKLEEILQTLAAEEINLNGLGFTDQELQLYQGETEPPLENILPGEPEENEAQLIPGTWYELGKHRFYFGDSQDIDLGGQNIGLIFDPPWDAEHEPPAWGEALVFTDSRRAGESLKKFGFPSWIFTWDCMNTHYTNDNRPLQRAKHCFFFGHLGKYSQNALIPSQAKQKTKSRITKNKRGSYRYKQKSEGVMLSDIYQQSISELHKNGHPHEKPQDWLYAMIANAICSKEIHDPFAGSGASLFAADRAGKTWTGAEINEDNAKHILKTWGEYEKDKIK